MRHPKPAVPEKRTAVTDPVAFMHGIATTFAESHRIVESELVQKFLGQLRSRSLKSALDTADVLASTEYHTPDAHRVHNQFAALVKKIPWKIEGLDPEAAALKKFWAAEHSCKRVNQRYIAEHFVGELRILP